MKNMKNRIECILTKIINILIIAMGIGFTPFQYYYIHLQISYGNLIVLLLLSVFIFLIGWFGLLRTNNPARRYNPFTINKRWHNYGKSIDEDPSQVFRLDELTETEIAENYNRRLREKRDKLIDKMIK